MMKALDVIWITGRGLGPGLPKRGFFTDNGTEFLNEKFKSLLQANGIGLRTTSTFSPQQNGVNERNHGTADILVTRIMMNDPFPNPPTSSQQSRLGEQHCDNITTRF